MRKRAGDLALAATLGKRICSTHRCPTLGRPGLESESLQRVLPSEAWKAGKIRIAAMEFGLIFDGESGQLRIGG